MAEDSSSPSAPPPPVAARRRASFFPYLIGPPPDTPTNPHDRLSSSAALRIKSTTFFAATAGAALGLAQGGQTTSLRFRAENSHRMPTTHTGWYLYHKSKNYAVMLGAGKEALRMALRLGAWTGLFFAFEEAVDGVRWRWAPLLERVSAGRVRGRDWVDARGRERVSGVAERDALSSVFAGMGVAGGFSAWNRLPIATAARMTKIGFFTGLGYGLAQDAIVLLQGRHLAYTDWLARMLRLGSGPEQRQQQADDADGTKEQSAPP